MYYDFNVSNFANEQDDIIIVYVIDSLPSWKTFPEIDDALLHNTLMEILEKKKH